MATKTFKGRIQNKHDTEANWSVATNFKPLAGELIIYDVDDTHSTPRLKVGDGSTLVNNLPFEGDDKASLNADNTFTGSNVFEKDITRKTMSDVYLTRTLMSNSGFSVGSGTGSSILNDTIYGDGNITQKIPGWDDFTIDLPNRAGTLALTSNIDVTAAGNNTFTGSNTFSKEAFTVNSNYNIAAIEVTKTGTTTIRSGIDNNCYIGLATGTLNINNTSGSGAINIKGGQSGTINITAGVTQGLNVSLGANSNVLKFNSNDGLKLTTYDFNLASTFDTDNKYTVKLNCGYHLSPATDPAGSYVDPGLTINDNTVSTKYRGGKIENTVNGTTYSLTLPSESGEFALTKNVVSLSSDNTFTGKNLINTDPITLGGLSRYKTIDFSNYDSIKVGWKKSNTLDGGWYNYTRYADGGIYRDVTGVGEAVSVMLPAKSGTIALTSDISDYVQANPAAATSVLTSIKIGNISYGISGGVSLSGNNTWTGTNTFKKAITFSESDTSGQYKCLIDKNGFYTGAGPSSGIALSAVYSYDRIKYTSSGTTYTYNFPEKNGTFALATANNNFTETNIFYKTIAVSPNGLTTDTTTGPFVQYGYDSIVYKSAATSTANGTKKTYSFPTASGTLALTNDIPIKTATLDGTTLSITLS